MLTKLRPQETKLLASTEVFHSARSDMFIDRRVHPYQLGSEERISMRASPSQTNSAPPNGAKSVCSAIYKHVTPSGVNPTINSKQLRMNDRPITGYSQNSSHQIVFLCFSNQNVHDLTRLRREIFRRIVNQNASINIRRLRFHSPLPEQITFGRLAFE